MARVRKADRCLVAAEAFTQKLLPGRFAARDAYLSDSQTQEVWSLVLAAFRLYEMAWDCHYHDIRQWQWPTTTLAEGGAFDGNQPWTVLLQRAVTIAQQGASPCSARSSPGSAPRRGKRS